MKAEINLENKARFFSLYWEQKIVSIPYMSGLRMPMEALYYWGEYEVKTNSNLELKPLSKISDEDAVEVGRLTRLNKDKGFDFKLIGHALVHWLDVYGTFKDIQFEMADFLRSRGYALPWMGISVEEMIEAGWVKLEQL